jgi:hypothetical protein
MRTAAGRMRLESNGDDVGRATCTMRAYRVVAARSCRGASHRLNVTLDQEQSARLARLAERTHVQEGTLARSLLAMAIEDADQTRAASSPSFGLIRAQAGETPLDEL